MGGGCCAADSGEIFAEHNWPIFGGRYQRLGVRQQRPSSGMNRPSNNLHRTETDSFHSASLCLVGGERYGYRSTCCWLMTAFDFRNLMRICSIFFRRSLSGMATYEAVWTIGDLNQNFSWCSRTRRRMLSLWPT